MKLSKKIGVIVFVLAVAMFFFYIFAVNTLKDHLIESRKHEIQSILTFSLNQVRHFVELEQANKMSREEAEENVIRLLSKVRDGNDFLWANDANGIARVHVSDNVMGVFQPSYAKYIDYFDKNNFMFVVGESKKANTNALFVKVNGMTLLPKWKWMLGMGVYVEELDAEAHKLAVSFVFASTAMFLLFFGGVFWVYRSIINQLGDDPKNVMSFVARVEHEGFHQSLSKSYPKKSLLFSLSNLYQYLHCILDSLRHQAQLLTTNSIELLGATKKIEKLIDAADQEGKRVSDVLSDNKKQVQQAYLELTNSGQYLDVVASRVADNIIINTNSEKEFKKIEKSIINDANKLAELSQKIQQVDSLIDIVDDLSFQNPSLVQSKAILSKLHDEMGLVRSSLAQSGGELTQLLNSFCKQRASLEAFGEHLVSAQQQIEEIAQAKEHLLSEMSTEVDLRVNEILSSLSTITELIADLKKNSDKMSYDLGCVKL